MTLKQWQGISHQIDDSLRTLAMQSLERLKDGGGDADLERREMIEARLAAAKMVMPDKLPEHQGRMPLRSRQQQAILRTRSRMEAALREVVAKRGISMLQLTCMHDLGITASLSLSLQDKELLIGTSQWRALLKAEIQSSKNKLDAMAKKQTRQCEHQAKRKEAREYLRDKKGPSKFCGNTHSPQATTEMVLGMPVGVMWINQEPTENAGVLVERIQKEVPSVEIQQAEGEVALLILAIPETLASEGAALVLKAQRAWKWKSALRRSTFCGRNKRVTSMP
jgi:hypothetical protein